MSAASAAARLLGAALHGVDLGDASRLSWCLEHRAAFPSNLRAVLAEAERIGLHSEAAVDELLVSAAPMGITGAAWRHVLADLQAARGVMSEGTWERLAAELLALAAAESTFKLAKRIRERGRLNPDEDAPALELLVAEVRGQRSEEPAGAEWPEPLAPEALHGLAGDIVRAIEPHSEADPAALLLQTLAVFGNAIGRRPYFRVEADQHHTNLFVVLVGATAKGRKGTSAGQVLALFERADPTWRRDRVVFGGLSSGEGLIWQVRDAFTTTKLNRKTQEREETVEDAGVDDKRLLIIEPEFANVLKVMSREGNNLSPIIRMAWDRGELQTLTKNSAARSTGAHVSIIGHITDQELRRHLRETETANGFANRFLYVCVRRSKCLAEGGNFDAAAVGPLVERLRAAIEFARDVGRVERVYAARELWARVYPELSSGKSGLFGAAIGRAEAQVVRLSSNYALLDRSAIIREEHLRAAFAVWEHTEESAAYIFDGQLIDPLAEKIFAALKEAEPAGLTRTALSASLGRHVKRADIDAALASLELAGKVRKLPERRGAGRTAEVWAAVEAEAVYLEPEPETAGLASP